MKHSSSWSYIVKGLQGLILETIAKLFRRKPKISLSQWCWWNYPSSGAWHGIDWYIFNKSSEEHTLSICRAVQHIPCLTWATLKKEAVSTLAIFRKISY